MDPSGDRRVRFHAVVAVALYLALAIVAARPVLPAPASTLMYSHIFGQPLLDALWIDQQLVLARVGEIAHALATHPWRIGDSGLCCPLPHSHALGEHMFGQGVVAFVVHAFTSDPILGYNAVVVLSWWLAACAMYALAYYWVGNPAAAFVAGCLFAFHRLRIGDPMHLFVHANYWTALALLFAHRLFERGRWRDAGALAACLGLQLLESFYTIVSLAIVGGVYGLWLVARHFRHLGALAPKLLAVVASVALLAAMVFAPYLHVRTVWGILGGRATSRHIPIDFAIPQRRAFAGHLALGLVAVALVDRLRRRPRSARLDPRLALLAAGVSVAWVSMRPFVLWRTSIVVPAPLDVLRGVVPGLDAVRAIENVGDGVQLIVALLAGIGAARLLSACPTRLRRGAATVLVGAALVEVLVPRSAGGWFGPFPMATWPARPPSDMIDLTSRLPPGAVLDLPYVPNKAHLQLRGEYLLLAAFHHQPTAVCHNSFASPLGRDIDAIVRRLPDVRAADALYALGFRTLLLHQERAILPLPHVAPLERADRVRFVAGAAKHVAYELRSPLPIRVGFDALGPSPSVNVPRLPQSARSVTIGIRNGPDAIYRHPDPLEPTVCLLRWRTLSGELVATQRQQVLLPLALGAGERSMLTVPVRVPVGPGDYDVTLAADATPDTPVGGVRVRVLARGSPSVFDAPPGHQRRNH
jgi:hypothetical protein